MKVYQLRIDINHTKPPVWRSVTLPMEATFAQLHDVIQELFGWEGRHMYEFKLAQCIIKGVKDDTNKTLCAADVTLMEKVKVGMKFTYTYDFGDDWEHIIKVEKLLEQEEPYPVLMKWAQDNLCEDIGGVYGYYEFMNKRNQGGEEAAALQAWFDAQHTPFHAKEVQEHLISMMITEDAAMQTWADFCDDLELIFMFVQENETAILNLHYENSEFYVRVHSGDKEYIQIFANKEDCAFASLHQPFPDNVELMYVEGIHIEFPDKEAMHAQMNDEAREGWAPIFIYHQRNFGDRPLTEADVDKIFAFLDVIVNMSEKHRSMRKSFPDMKKQKMTMITYDGEQYHMQECPLTWTDPIEEITFTPQEMKALKASGKAKDEVYLAVAPIENLLDDNDARNVVYYFLLQSEKEQDYQYMERLDFSYMSSFIKDFFLAYVRKHGCPKTIYCEDGHIIDLLKPICTILQIDLCCKCLLKDLFKELYTYAFEEQNPEHLFDYEFMEYVNSLDEEQIIHILQGNEEAAKRKMKRYISFMEMLQDE